MKRLYILLSIIVPLLLFGCTGKKEGESITVFAASSTLDLIAEIADSFEKDTGCKVKISAASSGTLARQLEEGADADIFISASVQWADYAKDHKLLNLDRPFLKNKLVLISYKDSPMKPFKLTGESALPSRFDSRLSIGDPSHVPAGMYAAEFLKYYGWYDSLKNRILAASNVRDALSVVELDEAQLGIVYKTDALKSNRVKIIADIPEESHAPILYYCATTAQSSKKGEDFFNYLFTSPLADKAISELGFERAGE